MAILKIRDNNGNVTVIPALEGRSAYQIAVSNGFIGTEKEWLNSLGHTSLIGTQEYWNNNLDIIPDTGQFVIITDYQTKEENGELIFIPGIKIGDGINPINKLPIIHSDGVGKLEHSLTIGEHVFDGTSDVIVGIYNGEMSNRETIVSTMTKQLYDVPTQEQKNIMDSFVEMQPFVETFSSVTLKREE